MSFKVDRIAIKTLLVVCVGTAFCVWIRSCPAPAFLVARPENSTPLAEPPHANSQSTPATATGVAANNLRTPAPSPIVRSQPTTPAPAPVEPEIRKAIPVMNIPGEIAESDGSYEIVVLGGPVTVQWLSGQRIPTYEQAASSVREYWEALAPPVWHRYGTNPVGRGGTPYPTTPAPRSVLMGAEPLRWSPLVKVPKGRKPFLTFSLTRIRVEWNGRDWGVNYRNPANWNMDGSKKSDMPRLPFDVSGPSHNTVSFPPDTHTLRVISLEEEAGDVFVEFRN